MANVKLNEVRSGVKLLSGLLKAAEREGNRDGKVSRGELSEFLDYYGDGQFIDDAMSRVHKYTSHKFNTDTPTVAQLNKALSDAARASALADKDDSDSLSPSERTKMAATWKSVVSFAEEYSNFSVRDIMFPRNAP